MGGNPTGIVFNGSDNFVVSRNGLSGPARFIFATEQGVIAAWSPTVDATHAIRMVDRSSTGASYKGLAISGSEITQLIYAADFHNARIDAFDQNFHAAALPGNFTDPNLPAGYAPFGIQAIGGDIYVTYAKQDAAKEDEVAGPGLGVVDVYDATFQPAMLPAGAFHDAGIPAGFAPFGIQAIGGDIYVTYAMQDAAGEDEVTGPGLGFVDLFTPTGRLVKRVATRGRLNAPWGVALAPPGFGRYANALLIGNFGDGRINAFEGTFGFPMGPLRYRSGAAVHIDGLWGIAFGNGIAHQPVNTLFFASGPDDEAHGLYGRLDLTR